VASVGGEIGASARLISMVLWKRIIDVTIVYGKELQNSALRQGTDPVFAAID
jgi:hypothetical protein